jgi:hypothetical protein
LCWSVIIDYFVTEIADLKEVAFKKLAFAKVCIFLAVGFSCLLKFLGYLLKKVVMIQFFQNFQDLSWTFGLLNYRFHVWNLLIQEIGFLDIFHFCVDAVLISELMMYSSETLEF